MSDSPNSRVGHLGVIVPVKTYSKAKSRLGLDREKTHALCNTMLEEVLHSIRRSDVVEKIVVVSKDESALITARRFGAEQVFDHDEDGVNKAVALGDNYFMKHHKIDTSIVIPQDVPLVTPDDIEQLCRFTRPHKNVIVVPSRRFDGTNALVRKPVQVIRTRYDEDSYKLHLSDARESDVPSALVLIRRIMMDVDKKEDLNFIMSQDQKPYLSEKFDKILSV